MQRWERLAGRSLPRPVVLEADLRQPPLGLSDARPGLDRGELRPHPAQCRQHDVSRGQARRTVPHQRRRHAARARACAARPGIREVSPRLDRLHLRAAPGPRLRKRTSTWARKTATSTKSASCAAEKLLRAADFLDQVTIYRPASVVGDSADRLHDVSSHGFYLPLQLAYVMADKVPTTLMGERFFRLLGLRGDEGQEPGAGRLAVGRRSSTWSASASTTARPTT